MTAYDILQDLTGAPPIDEVTFHKLVDDFVKNYLACKSYEERLQKHRNPLEVQQEIYQDLCSKIHQIQNRPEMRDFDPDKNSLGYVPVKIRDIWDADKEIKRLYKAVQVFCETRNQEFNPIAVHIAECRALFILEKKFRRLTSLFKKKRIPQMSKKFQIDRGGREGIPPYLKVYLQTGTDHTAVAQLLDQLPSVRTANITNPQSAKPNLTVYPAKPYDIDDTERDVKQALTDHFAGSPADPSFKKDPISVLSKQAYIDILDHILTFGKSLEHSIKSSGQLTEEGYRDQFVAHLNALSTHYSTKGEAFNRKGKTDILVFDQVGNNIFIGECKLWTGEAAIARAIDQLFDRYINWRDEKAALLIFNQSVKEFSTVIANATAAVKNHPRCIQFLGLRKDTSYSFLFRHPVDGTKTVKLELVLFTFV